MNAFEMTLPAFDADMNMVLNDRYKEILVLDKMLTDADIPHTLARNLDGWIVAYPNLGEDRVMDAIEHFGSYGNQFDKLETMWGKQVKGYQSAQEVFNSIKAHYEKGKESC